jgi:hypothetical protein
MKLSREKITDLMNIYCCGKYNRFARELELDPAHLHRFLTKDIGGGKKVMAAVIMFCKKNELNFENYIEV